MNITHRSVAMLSSCLIVALVGCSDDDSSASIGSLAGPPVPLAIVKIPSAEGVTLGDGIKQAQFTRSMRAAARSAPDRARSAWRPVREPQSATSVAPEAVTVGELTPPRS